MSASADLAQLARGREHCGLTPWPWPWPHNRGEDAFF